MTKLHAVRPAGLAIAAFLASVSPTAMAQTATPVVPPAPVEVTPPAFMSGQQAAQTAPTTPAAPVFAPNQPVVQATSSVDERRAAAVAASEAEAASRSEAARSVPVTSRAAGPRAAPDAATAQQAVPAAPVASQGRGGAAPVAAPEVAPATTPAQATSAPTTAPTPAVATPEGGLDQSLLWALGGGALLFLGIGASAVLRRRRRSEGAAAHAQDSRDGRVAEARTSAAPVIATPAPAAYEPPVRAPAAPVLADSAPDSTLAAMVAAQPSAENPFRTQAKRTRRARYLLAQREAAIRAPGQRRVAPPQTIAAEDRSQTVYSFGKQGQRSGAFKPRNA